MSSCVFISAYDFDPRGPFTKAEEPMHSGPRAWRWLHLTALDKRLTRELLRNFTSCIGCPDCKRHFIQIQHDHPLEETNQFAWSVKVHNMVNASRGAPTVTLEEATQRWNELRHKNRGNREAARQLQ